MSRIITFLTPLLLAGCATPVVPHDASPEGIAVPLGSAVRVGSLVVTPQDVVEDSRCPENARCVWAGRLIVSTRIEGPGWRETLPLALGEPRATHGFTVTLVSGLPEKQASGPTRPTDYRFAFDGGR